MLIYYCCYITYIFTGFLFNSHETTVMRSVRRIERIAVKVIDFRGNEVPRVMELAVVTQKVR